MNIESSERAHERLLSVAAVCERTSLSRITIWRLSRLGQFPASVKLSAGRRAWAESAIRSWIAEKLGAG